MFNSLRISIVFFVVLAALFGSAVQPCLAGIEGSRHDLSRYLGPEMSVCEPCHPPHLDNRNQPVVWTGKPIGDTAFIVYTLSPKSNIEEIPGLNSLVCLGCHDGLLARGIQASVRSVDTDFFFTSKCLSIPRIFGSERIIADHPVGFIYRGGFRDQEDHGVPNKVFFPPVGIDSTGYGFKLYGSRGTFECGTCHDPHISGPELYKKRYFLRAPLNSICTDCHQNK